MGAPGLLDDRDKTQGTTMEDDSLEAELLQKGPDHPQPPENACNWPLHRDAGADSAGTEGEANDPSEQPPKLVSSQSDILPGVPVAPGRIHV